MKTWASVLASLAIFTMAAGAVSVRNDRTTTEYGSIGAAVAAAITGDTLLCTTGLFVETVFIPGKDLTLDGQYNFKFTGKVAGEKTIVQGPALPAGGSIFTISNAAVQFIDLDITGGHPPLGVFSMKGGGLHVTSKAEVWLQGCRVYQNTAAGYGGGIFATNSNVYLDHTVVTSNLANQTISVNGYGGGVALLHSTLYVTNASSIATNRAMNDGGGIYARRSTVRVKDFSYAVFENAADNGGGIFADDSDIHVEPQAGIMANTCARLGGGIYLENRSTLNAQGLGCSIGFNPYPNRSLTDSGGGIFADNSKVVVSNRAVVGANEAARFGGGICLLNSSTCRLDNAYMGYGANTNMAYSSGGGIYAGNSTLVITNGTLVQMGRAWHHGGGIYATNADISIAGSTIGDATFLMPYGNAALTNGGGLYAAASQVALQDSTIIFNAAGRGGGGLYLGSQSTLAVSNTSFFANFVTVPGNGYGGALCLDDCQAVAITDSAISTNQSSDMGGGMFVQMGMADGTATLTRVTLAHNEAINDGGAIMVFDGGLVRIVDSRIEYNEADSDGNGLGNGGGIYVEAMGTVELQSAADNLVMRNNSARRGGGIYILDEAACALVATQGQYMNILVNSASDSGGAVAMGSGYGIFTASGRVHIYNNVAATNGGGLSTLGGLCLLEGPGGNDTPFFYNNNAGHAGGAIYASGNNADLRLNRVRLGGSSTPNFTRGDNGRGGGIALLNGAELLATNLMLRYNHADIYGGGLYVSNANAFIRSAMSNEYVNGFVPPNEFFANRCTNSGVARGAAAYVINGTFELDDAWVASNRALRGGAFYFGSNAQTRLVNCVIATNTGSLGGGIWADSSRNTLLQCTLIGNSISGIRGTNVALMAITNCIIGGNTGAEMDEGFLVGYSDIEGGYVGPGNLNADPLFRDETNRDYRLTFGSPCTNAGLFLDRVDHDCVGARRPLDFAYDLGAYEYNRETTDSDGDTMTDGWEADHALNPRDAADALVDSDGDLATNVYEYVADTDPQDIADYFQLIQMVDNAGFPAVALGTSTQRYYAIHYLENLANEVWTNVPGHEQHQGTGGSTVWTDSRGLDTNRIYRAQVWVP